eukprot:c20517_g1_i1 orf=320-793(+)
MRAAKTAAAAGIGFPLEPLSGYGAGEISAAEARDAKTMKRASSSMEAASNVQERAAMVGSERVRSYTGYLKQKLRISRADDWQREGEMHPLQRSPFEEREGQPLPFIKHKKSKGGAKCVMMAGQMMGLSFHGAGWGVCMRMESRLSSTKQNKRVCFK